MDKSTKLKPYNAKYGSPRSNADSVEAVNIPPVYTITASGITVRQTNFDRDYKHLSTTMYVVSDGGEVVMPTTSPIVAGFHGQMLTLKGTSDTDYIKFVSASGLILHSGEAFELKKDCVLNLIYDSTQTFGWGFNWGYNWGTSSAIGGWRETSRTCGGF